MLKKCPDLEIGVRGHSRSSKVLSFNRSCMVSCQCSLVKSLNCTVFEIFDLQVYRDLETQVRVH